MPRLKVLFAVSECVPFAKTGGLADVAGALPVALASRGHDVRVVLPRYREAKRHAAERLPDPLLVPVGHGGASWAGVWEAPIGRPGELPARAYLLEHDVLFDRDGIYGDKAGGYGDNLTRYSFLSRGALALCRHLDWIPDIVHVHDWQTSLIPVYLNTIERHSEFGGVASVLTIHNLAYQGFFDKNDLGATGLGWDTFVGGGLEEQDAINLLKAGILHSTLVSTVSPRYALEIQTSFAGERLDGVIRSRGADVIGVLNGIDDAVWNPESDPHIAAPFSAHDLRGKAECKAALQAELGLPLRPDVPLLGLVSRLASQKGIDIIAAALEEMLSLDVQIAILGAGEGWAERLFQHLSRTSERVRAHIGMNEGLAHRIEAGSDIFLMPSRYEPCGLNQMYSQRYGTLPVVRAVGGLDDTVENEATGFKFDEMSGPALAQAVAWAVYNYRERPEHFHAMQVRSMTKSMGWGHACRQYEALYRLAVSRRRGPLRGH